MPSAVGAWSRRLILALASLSVWPAVAHAQSAENVAVVINDNSPESQRIGEYYARTRSLPAENVLRIRVAPEETVERPVYVASIETPIAAAIRRAGLHDRLLYLVLTKGVPLRIAGTTGLNGTLASVDSELTLLYRRMTGQTVPTTGKIDNPYFLGARQPRDAQAFSHREHDIYLVTRLDAFTVEEALALVDKAQTPSRDGRVVLGRRDDDAKSTGNQWMAQAAQRLKDAGHGHRTTAADGPALGLYTWGAIDPAQLRRATGTTFVAGAIAARLAAADARTFSPPPDNWQPSGSSDAATFFAGSSETLAADLIREGATGVSGQVGEPFLLGAVRPDVLFPAYFAGFNLAEAFYLATPALSWTTVIIGDPLCRPFDGRTLTSADLESPIDSRTGLPAIFAKRRLARAMESAPGVPEGATALAIRADTLLARGDRSGARAALEQAVATMPTATGLLLTLAQVEEADGLYDAAIDRYRRIIELQPANMVAVNNLAYALAVHKSAPAEALPLAKRAAALAPRVGSVLDTWAWVEHLLGNHAAAAKLLSDAIKLDPAVGEVRLHAAAVAAALGDRPKAQSELTEALRLDPSLGQRDETRRLRERIAALPSPKA